VTDSTYLEPLLDVLRDLVAWMKDQNIPGAVIGGVAAGLLGRPRVTRDVDAVLLLDISDAHSRGRVIIIQLATRTPFGSRRSNR
jgi:hypothetical protein